MIRIFSIIPHVKKGWSLLSTQEFKVSAAALGNDYLSIYIKL